MARSLPLRTASSRSRPRVELSLRRSCAACLISRSQTAVCGTTCRCVQGTPRLACFPSAHCCPVLLPHSPCAAGDTHLGGSDFDSRLVAHFAEVRCWSLASLLATAFLQVWRHRMCHLPPDSALSQRHLLLCWMRWLVLHESSLGTLWMRLTPALCGVAKCWQATRRAVRAYLPDLPASLGAHRLPCPTAALLLTSACRTLLAQAPKRRHGIGLTLSPPPVLLTVPCL